MLSRWTNRFLAAIVLASYQIEFGVINISYQHCSQKKGRLRGHPHHHHRATQSVHEDGPDTGQSSHMGIGLRVNVCLHNLWKNLMRSLTLLDDIGQVRVLVLKV